MAEWRLIVEKTDFVTEVIKTLAEGREVQVFSQPVLGTRVDIIVRVIKRRENVEPAFADIYTQVRVTAQDVVKHGPDSCLCHALSAANFDLGKYL